MKYTEHAESCKNQLGRSFLEVHRFLDQFYRDFGLGHRSMLHHQLGIEVIEKEFGEEARRPAELHIREDTGGDLPEDWSYYGKPLFVQIKEYARLCAALRQIYGEETFQKVQQKVFL